MWNLSQYVVHWGLSLTAPVLIMAQKRKLVCLVFGRFRIVESQNGRPTTAYGKNELFLLLGNWYFRVQIWNLHKILLHFHVSHIKIGQAVPVSRSNEFCLISIIRSLISIISQNRWCMTREPLVRFWSLMCDTWKWGRILCRFQICIKEYQYPNRKKVHFFAIC